MSLEMALNFIQHLNENISVQSKLAQEIGDADALLRISQESGFTFSLEEWNKAVAYVRNGELSEDDLNTVAGGALVLSGGKIGTKGDANQPMFNVDSLVCYLKY